MTALVFRHLVVTMHHSELHARACARTYKFSGFFPSLLSLFSLTIYITEYCIVKVIVKDVKEMAGK